MDQVLRRCLPTDCDDCKPTNGSSIKCDYAARICGPLRAEDLVFGLGSMCNYGLASKCAVKQGKNYDCSGKYSHPILEDTGVQEKGPVKRDDPSLRSSIIRRENYDSSREADQLILQRMADPNEV